MKEKTLYRSLQSQHRDDSPLDNNTQYPGGLLDWVYSRLTRPIAVTGAIDATGTFHNTWLAAVVSFWNEATGTLWTGFTNMLVGSFKRFFEDYNRQDAQLMSTKIKFDSSSQVADGFTWTVPVGKIWDVVGLTIENDTRAVRAQGILSDTVDGIFSEVITQNSLGFAASCLRGIRDTLLPAGYTVQAFDNAWMALDTTTAYIQYYEFDEP